MESLYMELVPILPESKGKLTKFEIFFISFNCLRLSTSFDFFKYHFNVFHQTVSKYFHKCLFVLNSAIKNLVFWPERDILKSAMPTIFKQNFRDVVNVIVDCFEIAIQSSSQKKVACALQAQQHSKISDRYSSDWHNEVHLFWICWLDQLAGPVINSSQLTVVSCQICRKGKKWPIGDFLSATRFEMLGWAKYCNITPIRNRTHGKNCERSNSCRESNWSASTKV